MYYACTISTYMEVYKQKKASFLLTYHKHTEKTMQDEYPGVPSIAFHPLLLSFLWSFLSL